MVTRYDACLDSYEPGETEAYVDGVFNPLKAKLIELLKVAKENQKSIKVPSLKPYSVDKQEKLGRKMLETIHYDMRFLLFLRLILLFREEKRQENTKRVEGPA